MSIEDNIKKLDILIRFCRDDEIKGELAVAREMMEYSKFFLDASDEIIDKHSQELDAILAMAKRFIDKY